MFPPYIHTIRELDNFKNINHQGLAKVLPYYKSDAKSEKSKHIAIITGIKKDIELNLGNVDPSAEIYRLFYLEKKNEITKRWQGEFGENVFKYKAENFKVNWADLDDWNQTQNKAIETDTLTRFNRIVFTTRRLYFHTTLAFNYDQMDGLYGNFVPSFALPKWQFNWGVKPEARIKLYGQTLPGYTVIPSDYARNIKIGSLHLWQAPRLLLPTPKIGRIRTAYAKRLDQVRQNFLFYNLFKLQIYKFWRHDSFGEGQAKRRSKVSHLAWWNKRPKFHYKPGFFHLVPGQFYKNRPFYERFNSIHAFAQKVITKHIYSLANEQLTLERKQFQSVPFSVVPYISRSFANLLLKFPSLKSYYSDLEFCIKSSQILKFNFIVPTTRQQLILISPILERHWPRVALLRSKQIFPKYMKNRSRRVLATLTYKARTQLQWLGERLGNRFEKLYGYFLKTVLLLIVAHQKLVALTALNIPKFEPIINTLVVGLIRRQKLSQNVRITFNNLFDRLVLDNNRERKHKYFKFPAVPTQLPNAFLDSNNLEITKVDNHYNFYRNLTALETLVPIELLPLLAFIGTHSLAARIPFEMNTKDFKAIQFDANLYRHFISSVGFRYYYADRLSSALRTSLQSKPTLELNASRTLLLGSISTRLLVDNLWLKGRWKINFYRELIRQRIQQRRRQKLLLSN